MEPNIINDFIQHIANGVVQAVGGPNSGLIPTGMMMAQYLVTLSCMMLGFSLVQGLIGFAVRAANFLIVAAGTHAAIANWATVVLALPGLTRDIGADIIPGFNGPMTLFGSAIEVANRLGHASVSFSFSSWSDAISSIGAMLGSPFIIPVIFLGMISTGVCAIVMEICLLLGTIMGPLLIPFLAFGLTAPVGMAYLTFLLYAMLEVVMMSALSHFVGAAVIDIIVVPGRADEITNTDVYILLGLGGIMTVTSGVLFYVGGKMVGSGFGTISSRLAGSAIHHAGGMIKSGLGSGGGTGRSGAPAWSAGSSGGGAGGGGSGGPGWAGSGAGWAGSPFTGGGSVSASSSSFGASRGGGSPFARGATP